MAGLDAATYDGRQARRRAGRPEEPVMNWRDKRLWSGVAAVLVVLLIIAWAAGWFGAGPPPEATPQ